MRTRRCLVIITAIMLMLAMTMPVKGDDRRSAGKKFPDASKHAVYITLRCAAVPSYAVALDGRTGKASLEKYKKPVGYRGDKWESTWRQSLLLIQVKPGVYAIREINDTCGWLRYNRAKKRVETYVPSWGEPPPKNCQWCAKYKTLKEGSRKVSGWIFYCLDGGIACAMGGHAAMNITVK